MMSRTDLAPVAESIEKASIELEQQRRHVAVELVGSILSDAVKGIELSDAAGIVSESFVDEDLRLIYAGAFVARNKPKGVILRLASRALQQINQYDESDTRSFIRGPIWNPEGLASLACSYPSPAMVPHLAEQLLTLNRRAQSAEHHFGIAWDYLTNKWSAEDRTNDIVSAPTRVVVLPMRKRGAA
jgi:hypothetical protein